MQVADNQIDSISHVINICIDRHIHFAAYQLPENSRVTLVIQKQPEIRECKNIIQEFPDKGFLIAPFSRDTRNKTYLISPDLVIHEPVTPGQIGELLSLPSFTFREAKKQFPTETGKEDYIRLINETIQRIREGEFEKVVLSRVKPIIGNFSSKLTKIFHVLCNTYNDAFVYLFCLNGQYWIGATHEPFICSQNDELSTVSLAGTRLYNENNMKLNNWNRKELLEQEYVTRHIEKVLLNYSVTGYKKTGPYVVKAGNLSHLRTDFTFSVQSAERILGSLISALHPTPAVCGMDSGKAMDFIHKAEKHNREYYTGFLGPLGIDEQIQLYVNLRCMKVFDDRFILYIGGGITLDSIPEEEWNETEFKADTLLSVLHQIK
jgi:isochorismate synthase